MVSEAWYSTTYPVSVVISGVLSGVNLTTPRKPKKVSTRFIMSESAWHTRNTGQRRDEMSLDSRLSKEQGERYLFLPWS
jgi:hypothetical protein